MIIRFQTIALDASSGFGRNRSMILIKKRVYALLWGKVEMGGVGVKKNRGKNAKVGKNKGGCPKFGWKKSKIWKKSGGGCDFGLIWENRSYLPGIFS